MYQWGMRNMWKKYIGCKQKMKKLTEIKQELDEEIRESQNVEIATYNLQKMKLLTIVYFLKKNVIVFM